MTFHCFGMASAIPTRFKGTTRPAALGRCVVALHGVAGGAELGPNGQGTGPGKRGGQGNNGWEYHNVGIAIINQPILMVYITHKNGDEWGMVYEIAIPTLSCFFLFV